MRATAEQQKTALTLTWKSDEPIWTEHWPLSHEKLQALEQLAEEQLSLNHIASTTSPWNSPFFVIYATSMLGAQTKGGGHQKHCWGQRWLV